MKAVVVGCGVMGRTHAMCYQKMTDVELVGVCDSNFPLAEELANSTGTQAFESFDEMMTKIKPDVVSVTLPTYLHKTFVVKAADYGSHLICEKPIAHTLQDAREMIEHCEKKGVRLFVGHVLRYFPAYAEMKEKIKGDMIGIVEKANTRRAVAFPESSWYRDSDKGGNVIFDLMIHDIDYLRWVLGEVKTIQCIMRRTEKLEYATSTLRFENGATANLEAYWGAPGSYLNVAEVIGSQGKVRFDSTDSPVDEDHVESYTDNPYYCELKNFVDCIRDDSEALVTTSDAYKAIEIALAGMESARAGKAVIL
ncbi:Gfo/Idh/MocA family oxidoreductase [Paenibacillus alvei]|uniref:Gfo/Idh/MocA family oxidoreductase n=1 Tax=Paenibacillus alvei TaxID=44250 RepID=A0ABT4E932_PAEAL|nr:Gfo/Idh/MocA family oxidoreductase [Paenibacillus alvei]MCY9530248.1 Gfo/Idh/MocA family oxidoreductase [Paenibacillus alvei]